MREKRKNAMIKNVRDKKMAVKIYHGDILFTPSADRLEIHEKQLYNCRRWSGFTTANKINFPSASFTS